MRRLTAAQYINSVRDLLGEVSVPTDLEPDTAINGLVAVGNSRTTISPTGVEKYETAAYDVAQQAMSTPALRDAIVRCTPAGPDDAECARETVSAFGRRAFRRPLSEIETTRYVDVATLAGRTLGDFYQGLEFALAGLLQSPNFLFRVELGEVDPTAPQRRHTDYEMATRLSYLLWNTTPDDALLDAAESGLLTTDAGLREQAARLLSEPRARESYRMFFMELLDLVEDFYKDADAYPDASPTLSASAREGVLRTVNDLIGEQDAPYPELFQTRVSYVNGELAAIYGVEAPGTGFARVMLPEDGMRVGLLGQAAFLARQAHSTASSPTLRGKFVRQTLLCQTIPPPPDDIGELPEPSPDLPTMRERLAEHRTNDACATCHALTDPIGLGLENFDGMGAFRLTENDAMINASGDLDGMPFTDASDLGAAVGSHPELGPCLVRNLYRYATGHIETDGEEVVIRALAGSFSEEARLRQLLLEIVMSDGFRFTGGAQ
jgi:hypothetical protein